MGGEFIEGMIGQPSFINPIANTQNLIDKSITQLLFSSLDDVVAHYQISDDQKTWAMSFHENALWSDGKPVTADDVIYTLEIIQNPSNNHPLHATWKGIVVEKINKDEVRFTLKTPYVFMIDNIKELRIAPAHIFKSIPVSNIRLSRFNLEPVSNGPFKLDGFDTHKDGFINNYRLVRNEKYFGKKPYIEKIHFKLYSNENELIQALNRREIQAYGDIQVDSLKKIKVDHTLLTLNLSRYYAIFFNPSVSEALKSRSVRTALDYATDKKTIVSRIFNDRTIIMQGPLPPHIRGYDKTIYANTSFDSKKAEMLLEEDGWTKNEKGAKIKKIGRDRTLSLTFNIIVPETPFLVKTIQLIQKDWESIGVKLNPIILNNNDIHADVIKDRNYDMIIFGNILKKNPDTFSFWHSSERFYPGHNLALFNEAVVDSLLENIRQDSNEETRKEKIKELQKKIHEENPAIFLYSPSYLYIVPEDLKGFQSYIISDPSHRFDTIKEWYLSTEREFQNQRDSQ